MIALEQKHSGVVILWDPLPEITFGSLFESGRLSVCSASVCKQFGVLWKWVRLAAQSDERCVLSVSADLPYQHSGTSTETGNHWTQQSNVGNQVTGLKWTFQWSAFSHSAGVIGDEPFLLERPPVAGKMCAMSFWLLCFLPLSCIARSNSSHGWVERFHCEMSLVGKFTALLEILFLHRSLFWRNIHLAGNLTLRSRNQKEQCSFCPWLSEGRPDQRSHRAIWRQKSVLESAVVLDGRNLERSDL